MKVYLLVNRRNQNINIKGRKNAKHTPDEINNRKTNHYMINRRHNFFL